MNYKLNNGPKDFKLNENLIDFQLNNGPKDYRLNAITEPSGNFRLLEDGFKRLLENGSFRLLE